MRCQAYIGVVGGEQEVRQIHEHANIPDATIKHYLKVAAEVSPTGLPAPWGWSTARVPVSDSDPDQGVKSLLQLHRALIPVLRAYRQPGDFVCVTLIAQYEDEEDRRGLCLSSETIALISEFGAAFEMDVVSLMKQA